MDKVLSSVREEYSKEQVEKYRKEEAEAIEREFNPMNHDLKILAEAGSLRDKLTRLKEVNFQNYEVEPSPNEPSQ